VIDAKTGMVICTLPVGGKPEFAQADGKGKIYFNVENTSEIMELDEAKAAITKRIKLAPCDGPSGLAIDSQKRRLFAVCGNKLMAVVDPGRRQGSGDASHRRGFKNPQIVSARGPSRRL